MPSSRAAISTAAGKQEYRSTRVRSSIPTPAAANAAGPPQRIASEVTNDVLFDMNGSFASEPPCRNTQRSVATPSSAAVAAEHTMAADAMSTFGLDTMCLV